MASPQRKARGRGRFKRLESVMKDSAVERFRRRRAAWSCADVSVTRIIGESKSGRHSHAFRRGNPRRIDT